MGSNSSSGNQGGGGSRDSNRKAKKDLEVSGYEAAITKQNKGTKKEINKGLNITTSSNDNKMSGYKPADYNPEKDDTTAKMDLFINDPYTKKQGGPLILRPLEFAFDAGAKKTRTFFSDKVLNSKRAKQNIGYTKEEFSKLSRTKQEEVYKGYMSKRQSGSTDAYGNKLNKNSGSDNQVVQAPPVATIMPVPIPKGTPTEVEISQSQATEAKEDDILLKKRKTKAKGRSQTIMTGVTGATGSLTLGKPSLLGM